MPDIDLAIDPLVYRLSAVKKAAYRLGGRCHARIEVAPGGEIRVRLRAKSGDETAGALEGDFLNEVLDQDLRESIAEETERVRNLLLAQAFSGLATAADAVDYREDPLGIGRSRGPGH